MAQTRVTISRDVGRLLREASLPQLEAIRARAEQALRRNTPVDTGALGQSTYARLDRTRGIVQVGADTPYARFVEYGYRHHASGRLIPPNPFLRRSIDQAVRVTGRRR